MLRNLWEFDLLQAKTVALYPTIISQKTANVANSLTMNFKAENWRDPLHAFWKASNVCSLRIVAAISTTRAEFKSKNALNDAHREGIAYLS